MSWHRNLRMTPKLVGSFILVAFLTGVVGAAGFVGLRSQNDAVGRLTNVSYPSVVAISNTKTRLRSRCCRLTV
jgi:hypothetical protein